MPCLAPCLPVPPEGVCPPFQVLRSGNSHSCPSAGGHSPRPGLFRAGAPSAGTAGLWLVPVAAWGDKSGEGPACLGCGHPVSLPEWTLKTHAVNRTQIQVLASPRSTENPVPGSSALEPRSPGPSPSRFDQGMQGQNLFSPSGLRSLSLRPKHSVPSHPAGLPSLPQSGFQEPKAQ